MTSHALNSAATYLGAPHGNAVVVDPFEHGELRELAALTGLPVRTCTAWPFDLLPRDRVISTVPVPRAHAGDVLGVVVGMAPAPGIGEAWPERTVRLEDGATAVVAHLSGDSDPAGRLVAVVGLRGGIGTTTLAAALARTLAEEPLAVSLLDSEPIPRLRALLGVTDGLTWADLAAGNGPLLPHRMDSGLPLWERVRVLTADERGSSPERFLAAIHALRCTHDVVVADLGRDLAGLALLRPDLTVLVLEGELVDIAAASRILDSAPGECVAAVRSGSVIPPAEAAMRLGVDVVALGTERGSGVAAAHGCRPGDRPRGAIMRAARDIAHTYLDIP